MSSCRIPVRCAFLFLAVAAARSACGGEAIIAVATNFSEAAGALRHDFLSGRDDELTLSAGSTGKLYAQIVNGAPYDVFLAADSERPLRLEESGRAIAGSRFVYAEGRLGLWQVAADADEGDWRQVLEQGAFERLAIANPDLAPYGLAARQALRRLGLWDRLRARIVMGENVGQTYALVATGNAELGIAALSSLVSPRHEERGRYWVLPERLHDPVVQEAVLLRRGADNPVAIAFLDYLKSEAARPIIASFGYGRD